MKRLCFISVLLVSVVAPTSASRSESSGYNEHMASLKNSKPVFQNQFGSAELLRAEDLPGLGAMNYAVELLTVQPCAAVATHYHPNANQLVHVISGSFLHTQFINGTRHQQQLGAGMVSVTPAGTLHGVSNPSCHPVNVLVAFSSSAFSRTAPITQLAALPPHLLAATFGVDDPSACTAPLDPPAAMVYPLDDAACTAHCAGTQTAPKQPQLALRPREGAGEGTCRGADAHADAAASLAASSATADPFNADLGAAPLVVESPQGSVRALLGADLPGLALTSNSLFRVRLAACSLLLPHFHPDAQEIVFVLQGEVEAFLQVGSQRGLDQQLTSGDVATIPAGSLHSFANRGCVEVELYAVMDSAAPAATLPAAELLRLDDRELRASFGIPRSEYQQWRAGVQGSEGLLAPLLDKACIARCELSVGKPVPAV